MRKNDASATPTMPWNWDPTKTPSVFSFVTLARTTRPATKRNDVIGTPALSFVAKE
jgi:hypothetical protein